ncbi:MAG: hypothetical protein ACKVQB_11065 [Bacteroidia bacterium]
MKKVTLVIFTFLFTGAFAQKFTIKNKNGNILYLDQTEILDIKVEGYDSSSVIATASIQGILTGENGKYFVSLDHAKTTRVKEGDKVEITVFVEKEDGNYMLGTETYYAKRKNNFEMCIGNFRTGDKLTATDIDAMDNMMVFSDNTAARQASEGFKVVSFQCLIVPIEGPAEAFEGNGSNISTNAKMLFKKWQDGSRILFDDIVLENAKGDRKLGSRMMLIYSEERGVYIQQFYNKEFLTKDEFLKLGTIDAIDKSNGEIYLIKGYHLLIVHKYQEGKAGAFESSSNQLTKKAKDYIETNLKPGDRIFLDDIIYQKPDGTEGTCWPLRIFIL